MTTFRRDSNVIAKVLERANEYCEGCENPAPFIRALDGTPYCSISRGWRGYSRKCSCFIPNCHCEVHFGSKKEQLRTKLLQNDIRKYK